MELLRLHVFLLGNRALPSAWFRVFQLVPHLQRAGLDLVVHELPDTGRGRLRQFLGCFHQALVRWRQLGRIRPGDLVLVQKGLSPARLRGLRRRLRRTGAPFLYDIDDAVHLEAPIRFPGWLGRLQDLDEPRALMESAACVVAGNAQLREDAEARGARAVVIPTTIDTQMYGAAPAPDRGAAPAVIGWSGSTSTNRYVGLLAPALTALAKRHAFVLRVMSNDLRNIDRARLEAVAFEFVPWRREVEVEVLRGFSIGVMPLTDSVWERRKCGLKALQYMALGLPVVCSPVGVNREIVRDGENGFLAASDREWEEKLEALLSDSALRSRMGAEARRTVLERYSAAAAAQMLLEALEQMRKDARRET